MVSYRPHPHIRTGPLLVIVVRQAQGCVRGLEGDSAKRDIRGHLRRRLVYRVLQDQQGYRETVCLIVADPSLVSRNLIIHIVSMCSNLSCDVHNRCPAPPTIMYSTAAERTSVMQNYCKHAHGNALQVEVMMVVQKLVFPSTSISSYVQCAVDRSPLLIPVSRRSNTNAVAKMYTTILQYTRYAGSMTRRAPPRRGPIIPPLRGGR